MGCIIKCHPKLLYVRHFLTLLFIYALIMRDRCLYSTAMFHSGRTHSGVMFGLGTDRTEEGHSLNHDSGYYYRSSSFRSVVIPNILSSSSDKLCWKCSLGDQWRWPGSCRGQIILCGNTDAVGRSCSTVLIATGVQFGLSSLPVCVSWKWRHSNQVFPLCRDAWYSLSCSNFLTVWLNGSLHAYVYLVIYLYTVHR